MINKAMKDTILAIHEHDITGEDQDGISTTVAGVEEYVKEHMWQIIDAMIEIAARELIHKLNTDKHR